MVRSSPVRLVATLLVGFLALGAVAQTPTRGKDFWKLESERLGADVSLATFAAKSGPAKGQGVLMWALWPDNKLAVSELDPAVILAGLYRDLKDFQLQGRKATTWGNLPAQVVAFKATVDKRTVTGRALLTSNPDGTQALLLVSHPEAQSDFSKEFERLQKDWQFTRSAATNVLYSE